MHSRDDVRDRLEELRRVKESCDYYDPQSNVLKGQIEALEWVLSESADAGRSDAG